MPYLRFPLRTVSPLINKGTSKIAELRTPSVIGQLRFWLRAILGAQLADSEAVYQQESMLLGSTSTASSVMMQLREHAIIEESVRVLPHSSDRRKSFEEESIFDNSSFDLKLIFRPGTTLDPRLAQALSLWLLLGGLGKRSRRMFGSIQLQSYPRPSKTFDQTDTNYPDWWANWEQIEKRPHLYARLVQLSLEIAFAENGQGRFSSEPTFPILHSDYCRVIVAEHGFDSAEKANIALFEVLRKDEYRNRHEYMFGSGKPRRASPLIAQGRVFGDKYYPVFTCFRSPIDNRGRADWDVVDAAMDELEDVFNGQTVFGGKLDK